ncbi:MAG TPA: ATP-binding protein [Kofleriaceae bacterium]|nr:ATP-binding protein [Kofleriaceae bacterium]
MSTSMMYDLASQSAELFRLLVASVRDYAIFMLDPRGYIATWNAGAQRFKGYTAREIVGRHFSVFYPEDDVRAGKCEYELEVAARDGRFEDEGWRIRKDGSRFWANVVITAMHAEDGTLVGFAKVTRDLTDRKRSEEERAARLVAEESNRVKDEFLAILGHELRNPLAPIVTALQLIKLRGDSKSAREHSVIERQVKQMSRLVDDLLDVSRIARGKIELRRQPLDLREPLAQAVEIASPLFEQKGQHFEVRVPPHALAVAGDESRLVQVFANLLTNAARYTPAGGQIVLAVRLEAAEVVTEVRDNGAGIAPELLPRIFEPFVQGHQDSARSQGGLGIGLSLVRSLVDLHAGRIEVQSAGRGAGSRFVVHLPRHSAPPAATAEPVAIDAMASDSPRRRVLYVEDNEDARLVLADALETAGHVVQAMPDATTALDALASFTPDVVILDLGLPGIDGFELAVQLRARLGAAVGLIALSGYGQPNDRERSKAAGIDVHLTKPVQLADLLQHLVAR